MSEVSDKVREYECYYRYRDESSRHKKKGMGFSTGRGCVV